MVIFHGYVNLPVTYVGLNHPEIGFWSIEMVF
jgi:hypothetical protein